MKIKACLLMILTAVLLMSGCAVAPSSHAPVKKIRARITYYNSQEDKYHDQVACSPTIRAKQGLTVAAHPDFKFGTKLNIPELKNYVLESEHFLVQDRGSAVTKKRASHGDAYVFDVYVSSKRLTRYLEKYAPEYMDVYVQL